MGKSNNIKELNKEEWEDISLSLYNFNSDKSESWKNILSLLTFFNTSLTDDYRKLNSNFNSLNLNYSSNQYLLANFQNELEIKWDSFEENFDQFLKVLSKTEIFYVKKAYKGISKKYLKLRRISKSFLKLIITPNQNCDRRKAIRKCINIIFKNLDDVPDLIS
jgi:hypothetical protein